MSGAEGDARAQLLALILRVSFERREVTLASGRTSNFYLDLRQTLMRPLGQKLAGALLLERLRAGAPVAAVGGMAVAAVPLVSALLAAEAQRDEASALCGFFVRKEAKAHGLGRRIEGGLRAGMDVALVEDTTTTGASALEAAALVEEAGARVRRVLSLVDRGEGAAEVFAARRLTLEPLFTRADLPV